VSGLWTTLLPLILGSALVPVQLIITILLLRSGRGPMTAAAFVAGMTSVRLVQGVVFGLLLAPGESDADSSGSNALVSGVLLALAMILYATAARQALVDEDADAPSPKWITMTETMSPGRAFLVGAGVLAIGAKFWVFTLGAMSAIGDADLSRTSAVLTFLAFVLLTVVLNLVIIGAVVLAPDRSASALDAAAGWLKEKNGVIVIVVGVVFGTWFLVKGLSGFGVI